MGGIPIWVVMVVLVIGVGDARRGASCLRVYGRLFEEQIALLILGALEADFSSKVSYNDIMNFGKGRKQKMNTWRVGCSSLIFRVVLQTMNFDVQLIETNNTVMGLL